MEWKKQEGESVAVGDVLAEVETDKAVMELVARAAGTMLKHIVEAGSTVPVSEPVAVIGQPGEAMGRGTERRRSSWAAESEAAGQRGSKDAQATQPSPGQNRPVSMPPAPPLPRRPRSGPVRAAPARTGNGAKAPAPGARAAASRIKASPLARRIAAERGRGSCGCDWLRTRGPGRGPRSGRRARRTAQACSSSGPSSLPLCPAAPPALRTSLIPTYPSARSGRRSRGDWPNPSARYPRFI